MGAQMSEKTRKTSTSLQSDARLSRPRRHAIKIQITTASRSGQILTSNTRALRTHAVSHDGTELHLLHVAALLPPQARLEHLEKALRAITASDDIDTRTAPDVVCLALALGCLREPCFRKTSATALKSIRELVVTQENSALWSTSYPQRFRELLRFVPPPAPAPTTTRQARAAEMGPRARDHRRLIEAPHQTNVL
ncbi:hypothetical protein Q7P35_004888 [Cladosporium inversicolor]